MNSEFTNNVTEWGVKYTSFEFDMVKVTESKAEKMRSLNVSNRNILRLKNFDFLNVFKNVRSISLKGHELRDLEETNAFFDFIKKFVILITKIP